MTSPSSQSLDIQHLSVKRGEAVIVQGVSFSVPPAAVTVLLGPNGAGKTTLLEALSGVLPTSGGTVTLAGTEIQNKPRTVRSRLGLAHVEQGRTVFPGLTVEENLLVGAGHHNPEESFALFPELDKRRKVPAGSLSGGEQQMVVLARALLTRPKFLMVDEMSLGLAPLVVRRLMPVLQDLAAQGVGVLLVEQFAQLALSIGHQALVMSHGNLTQAGSCREMLEHPDRLRAAYLGG